MHFREPTRALKREGSPIMPGVPQDYRKEDRRRQQSGAIGLGTPPPDSRMRIECHEKRNRGAKQGDSVLREQSEAEAKTHAPPGTAALGDQCALQIIK